MLYLIALVIFVIAVIFPMIIAKRQAANETTIEEKDTRDVQSDCCGAHEIYEFDDYKFKEEIIECFDEEELDALRNICENQLKTDNINELPKVPYSLKNR